MIKNKLVILACLMVSNLAHASFNADFASVPVTVATRDGKPLAGVRVQYGISATGKGTCRNSDSPFDFGHSCPTHVEITEPQFVVTDANGKAVVPALKASSKVWAEKEPKLAIFPQGLEVKTKDTNGRAVVCSYALTADWTITVNDEKAFEVITEEVSRQLSNKNLVFKHYYGSDELNEIYLKNAEAVVNREIRDYGDQGLQMNKCR